MVICVAIILYRKFSILCKKNIISEIKMDTFHRADTDGTAKIISKTDKVSIPNGGKGPESKDVDDYDYIYEEQGKEEEEEETSYMYSCYDRNVLKIRSNLYSTE
ncbi:uncharacterized protein LOC133194761 [Saccostrea echinata]|uniref:uncharacterized protein LOC133194761 n=1 Tax=Saccostrea echinata TaxID=191078 RepID=UPI002A83A0F0|nr:uncharacterized protein LOC133194761 [Saccostrea echinata]